MKKILLSVLVVIFAVSVFAACGGSSGIKLTGFGNEEVEVLNGDSFVLDLTAAKDENGNKYEVSAVVKDTDGNTVTVTGGRFTASDLRGYTVVYTAALPDGKTVSRTVTVTVKDNDKPNVVLEAAAKTVKIGGDFILPVATVTDRSGEIISPVYEITDTDGSVQEYDKENMVYVPTAAGEFKLTVSATDSSGNTGKAEHIFYVRTEVSGYEYESFDDIGSLYDFEPASTAVQAEWHAEKFGKSGVLSIALTGGGTYSERFKIYPKEDKAFYEGCNYIVISMYVEGKQGSMSSLSWADPGNLGASAKITNGILYNGWQDYVLPAGFILNGDNLANCFTKESQYANKNWGYAKAAVIEDVTLYIGSIHFAEEILQAESTLPADYSLGSEIDFSKNITLADNELCYTVLFGGKPIAFTEDKFTPEWQGEYTVLAGISGGFDTAVGAGSFTFEVIGEDILKFNAYSDIVLPGGSHVLPDISVENSLGVDVTDDYDIQTKITFIDINGEITEDAQFFDDVRGRYIWSFTAVKEGFGFNAAAEVISGEFAEGEILAAGKTDSYRQMGSMFAGSASHAASVPAGYDDGAVKFSLTSGLSSTLYFNLNPAKGIGAYNDYDFITAWFYFETDQAELESVVMSFFGSAQTVAVNQWVKAEFLINNFLTYQSGGRLYRYANWIDYFLTVKPSDAGVSLVGKAFSVYFGDITAEKAPFSPELADIQPTTYGQVFNSNIAGRFVAAADMSFSGDYTGNATRFAVYNSPSFKLNSKLKRADLENYSHISVWLCVESQEMTDGSYVQITGGIIATAHSSPFLIFSKLSGTFNQWRKIYVPMDIVLNNMTDTGEIALFGTYASNVASTNGIYVGNITAENI